MRIISTCLRRQGSPNYSLGWFISVCSNFASTGDISQIFHNFRMLGDCHIFYPLLLQLWKKHIYKNLPPQDKSWREDVNKQTEFPLNQCTYCTHLAGFYTDDTSPWVLSSIHIQRFQHTRLKGEMKQVAWGKEKHRRGDKETQSEEWR